MVDSVFLKSANECRYDVISLGEVTLRLVPGADSLGSAHEVCMWEEGEEYNVARRLHKYFSQRAGVVTALVRDEVGLFLRDLVQQGGVDTSLIHWIDEQHPPCDPTSIPISHAKSKSGYYRILADSDLSDSDASQPAASSIDWDYIFGELGVRWFHTGCTFAGTSRSTGSIVCEAARKARQYGTIVSYDLDSRGHALKGVPQGCPEINREVAKYVDVVIGDIEQIQACLNFDSDDYSKDQDLDFSDHFASIIKQFSEEFPDIKAIASSKLKVVSPTISDWGAHCWMNGRLHDSIIRAGMEIRDPVDSGDSFISGFIYGMLDNGNPQAAIEMGASHGALAMTIPRHSSVALQGCIQKNLYNRQPRAQQ